MLPQFFITMAYKTRLQKFNEYFSLFKILFVEKEYFRKLPENVGSLTVFEHLRQRSS